MPGVTLYRLPGSHYSARAEYLLAVKGVPFERRTLTYRSLGRVLEPLTGQDEVPVLVHDGNTVTWRDIPEYLDAKFPDPPLLPENESARKRALALETWADLDLGHRVRRVAYWELVHDRKLSRAYFGDSPAARVTGALVTRWVMREYGITAVTVDQDLQYMDAVVAAAEDDLASRPYLCGDTRTRADIAVAALSEPLLNLPKFRERWSSFAYLKWVANEVDALKDIRRGLAKRD